MCLFDRGRNVGNQIERFAKIIGRRRRNSSGITESPIVKLERFSVTMERETASIWKSFLSCMVWGENQGNRRDESQFYTSLFLKQEVNQSRCNTPASPHSLTL